MARFVVRRMLWMCLVLFVVSVVTFGLMHAVPGGPFTLEKRLPQAAIDQLNAKYHLDAPLYQQYLYYVRDVLVPVVTSGEQSAYLDHEYLFNVRLPFGDRTTLRWMNFGPSYWSINRTVNDIFRDNLPVSMRLGAAGLLVSLCIGIPLGVVSALRHNTAVDYLATGVAVLGVSVPVIILGPILQYVVGVHFKWLPVSGWGGWQYLVLPAVALGVADAALLARLTRATLLQVLHQDYIRTARAKGLAEYRVIVRHALRNSLIPIVTVLGPMVASLMTGTFVVETMFGVPGAGKYFVTSVSGRDYPVIMGTVLLFAIFLVVANTMVDIAYAWLDPRIRYQ